MNPQNNQQPYNPQQPQQAQQPMQPTQPAHVPYPFEPKKKSKAVIVLIVLLIVTLVGGGAGGYYLLNNLNEKDEQLSTSQQALEDEKQRLLDLEAQKSEVALKIEANDAVRKNDLALFVSELNNFSANNNGTFPSTEPTAFRNEFGSRYLDILDGFEDPTTNKQYTVTPVAKVQTPPGVTLGEIQYQWPGACLGTEFDDSASERQAAARLILESGEIYCLDS